ncbi:MAG: hypothetical protein N2109_08510 [Fimbriimonadales bacterium]|nr:hypothetical protein [Fimbriimonadales bacterium]
MVPMVLGLTVAMASGTDAPPKPSYPTLPVRVPPRTSRFQLETPFPGLPPILLDADGNGVGLAQQTARARQLQARMLWIDATANLGRVNSREKIDELVRRIAAAGFNAVAFDVKPIVGKTLYPSRLAPKMLEWRGNRLPEDFDPLAAMVEACKREGLSLFVSLNAFSEGHRDVEQGPAYLNPEWQTVLYDIEGFVSSSTPGRPTFRLMDRPNAMTTLEDQLAVFTDLSRVPQRLNGDSKAAVVDARGVVLAQLDGSVVRAQSPAIPAGGSILVGIGRGAEFLRSHARAGDRLSFECKPDFVPITRRPWQQVPVMVSPHHPEVRRRALEVLGELLANYDVDGVLYDDRLRYSGLSGDFSEWARREFEAYVGERLQWPDDVFRWTLQPDLTRGVVPGKWFDAWLVFRAQTLRNWVAEARDVVERLRPSALFGVYAGSWYGEYVNIGSNYAASTAQAGFRFLTPQYQQTGFADLLDVFIAGCYYPTATIAEAMQAGQPTGTTVEASGQLVNRLIDDMAWTYAGLSIEALGGDRVRLQRALQAAAASTQGVMVFDLSHNIDRVWSVFQQAFGGRKVKAPHQVPGLLAEVRRRKRLLREEGVREPPVVINPGAAGTGL